MKELIKVYTVYYEERYKDYTDWLEKDSINVLATNFDEACKKATLYIEDKQRNAIENGNEYKWRLSSAITTKTIDVE